MAELLSVLAIRASVGLYGQPSGRGRQSRPRRRVGLFFWLRSALGAWAGGAPLVRPALKVGFWGALAMAVTAEIGALIGTAV